jgi:hypothetical protein
MSCAAATLIVEESGAPGRLTSMTATFWAPVLPHAIYAADGGEVNTNVKMSPQIPITLADATMDGRNWTGRE